MDNGVLDAQAGHFDPHPLDRDNAILAYFDFVKYRTKGHTFKQATHDLALESASRILSMAGLPIEEGSLCRLIKQLSIDQSTPTQIRDILVRCATSKNAALSKCHLISLRGIFRANKCSLSFIPLFKVLFAATSSGTPSPKS
jgi:hypothetical protein